MLTVKMCKYLCLIIICDNRLIIWECKDVISRDTITNTCDMYVMASLVSNEVIDGIGETVDTIPQQTDVHWRASDGFASFNWRMKWKVYMPCQKPPQLKLQIYDKNVGSDDSLAECIFSLTELYKAAFKKGFIFFACLFD